MRSLNQLFLEHLIDNGITGVLSDVDDTTAQTSLAFHDAFSEKFERPRNLTPELARKQYALFGRTGWAEVPGTGRYGAMLRRSESFLLGITPMPGAVEAMHILCKAGILVGYHTARNADQQEVTKRWKGEREFPGLPMVHRDTADFEAHTSWKAKAYRALYPHIWGVIENDARLVKAMEEGGYQGDIFLQGLHPEEYQPLNGRVFHCLNPRETAEIVMQRAQERK